jgi:hypothetical protein
VPSPTTRTTFWLLIAFVCIFGIQKAIVTPLDPDLFWHLRVAEQLRIEGIHPLIDHISFSSRSEPWTPYSWLAELGMKRVWDTTGYRGTIILQAVASTGAILFIALACLEMARRPSPQPSPGVPGEGVKAPGTSGSFRLMNCVLATVLAGYLIYPYLSFRPVTFAIFWLSLVAWLLLRDRRSNERSRAVWLVIPITILLANIHLVVILIPIWIACLFAGSLLERRPSKRYLILFIATALSCLATPLLPGAIRTALHYQSADVMVKSDVIGEMHPIYGGVAGIITCSILALLLVWALRGRYRVRLGEWLWLLVAIVFMLRLGRFIPMFAMIAAPVFAAALPAMSDAVLTRRVVRIALVFMLMICLGKLAWAFPRPSQTLDAFINADDYLLYPAKAAAYVETNITPRTHRLINEFTWGGYLGWRLGAQYQVFLDGRTQVFPAEFWRAVYLNGDEPRKNVLANANGDVAILPIKKSQFEKPLKELGWTQVYSDDRAQVLVPPGAQ